MISMPNCPPPSAIHTDAFIANLLKFPIERIPTPRRYERRQTKNYHLPKGVVCVGRPTKWCNPFDTLDEFKFVYVVTLEGGDYRHINCRPAIYYHFKRMVQDIHELRGKSLACWCKLESECHADMLLEFANEW